MLYTLRTCALSALCIVLLATAAIGAGIYSGASGPVSRGMGGASTAAPIDAIGALYWNPATISGLPTTELSVGLDIVLPFHEISSSVGPFSGTTEGESGVTPIPTIGWVYHLPDSPITIGLGIHGVAGVKTNLRADPNNPVLAPQPIGLGRITTEANFLQIVPVISYALRDNLSVAASPVVTLGQILLEPFVFDPPNADGTYPSGRSSRNHWGGGAQAGIYYIHNRCWHLGASIKSPAWMEEFRLFSNDELGLSRVLRAKVDLPMIVSTGISYSGLEDWLFALDLRYFDYKNADGLGSRARFDAMGELRGVDWSSVFALAVGAQRRINDALYVRLGYTYNQNPIKNSETFYNLASPLHMEHTVGVGASCMLCPAVGLNLSYSYWLPSKRSSAIPSPAGPIPGSRVSSELDVHFFSMGVVVRH